MRVSKRDRELAALYCAARSAEWSYYTAGDGGWPSSDTGASIGVEDESAAHELAELAHEATPWEDPDPRTTAARFVESWAEAEAMLRTGWVP